MDDKTFEIIIPVRTYSEQNLGHWTKKSRRHKSQQITVIMTLWPYRQKIQELTKSTKFNIQLTRIAPRKMDFDNLVYSFKWIVDAICDFIKPGLAKGRSDDQLQISYSQEKSPHLRNFSIKLKIETL